MDDIHCFIIKRTFLTITKAQPRTYKAFFFFIKSHLVKETVNHLLHTL